MYLALLLGREGLRENRFDASDRKVVDRFLEEFELYVNFDEKAASLSDDSPSEIVDPDSGEERPNGELVFKFDSTWWLEKALYSGLKNKNSCILHNNS